MIEIEPMIAYAAAEDAANRQMRKAGRTVWSKTDLELAKATLERMWPVKEPGR